MNPNTYNALLKMIRFPTTNFPHFVNWTFSHNMGVRAAKASIVVNTAIVSLDRNRMPPICTTNRDAMDYTVQRLSITLSEVRSFVLQYSP